MYNFIYFYNTYYNMNIFSKSTISSQLEFLGYDKATVKEVLRTHTSFDSALEALNKMKNSSLETYLTRNGIPQAQSKNLASRFIDQQEAIRFYYDYEARSDLIRNSLREMGYSPESIQNCLENFRSIEESVEFLCRSQGTPIPTTITRMPGYENNKVPELPRTTSILPNESGISIRIPNRITNQPQNVNINREAIGRNFEEAFENLTIAQRTRNSLRASPYRLIPPPSNSAPEFIDQYPENTSIYPHQRNYNNIPPPPPSLPRPVLNLPPPLFSNSPPILDFPPPPYNLNLPPPYLPVHSINHPNPPVPIRNSTAPRINPNIPQPLPPRNYDIEFPPRLSPINLPSIPPPLFHLPPNNPNLPSLNYNTVPLPQESSISSRNYSTIPPPPPIELPRSDDELNFIMYLINQDRIEINVIDVLRVLAELYRPRGLDEEKFEGLKTAHFNSSLGLNVDNCVICIEDFAENEEIKLLPCQHPFHTQCIASWLKGSTKCPLCKYEIDGQEE
jgi:Ring finger domain